MANQQRVNRSAAAPAKQRQSSLSPRRNDSPGPLLLQRTMAEPALLSPTDVLSLQRSYGNRAVNQLMGRQVVQRLISKEDFVSLAGPLTTGGKWKNSMYKRILAVLESYPTLTKEKDQKKALKKIISLAQDWQKAHVTEKKRVANKDVRKAYYISRLENEAEMELLGSEGALSQQTRELKTGRKQFTEKLSGKLKNLPTNAKFQFSVAAAIENKDYLEFSKARLNLTIQNRLKLWGKKSNEQIKKAAATQVIEGKVKRGELTALEKSTAIQNLIDASGMVGHTWVKFNIYDTSNQLIKKRSFGFWPMIGFRRPEISVPGIVKSPDTQHEGDSTQQQKDYEIDRAQYLKGMKRVIELYKSPPDYKLIDYNCTKFALDVAQSMGLSFPEGAYMRIPFKGLAWNPNALYQAIAKEKGISEEPKTEEENVTPSTTITEQEEWPSLRGVYLPRSEVERAKKFGAVTLDLYKKPRGSQVARKLQVHEALEQQSLMEFTEVKKLGYQKLIFGDNSYWFKEADMDDFNQAYIDYFQILSQ